MDPITAALMLGSAAVSAYGQVQSGRASQKASELNAYNIETENKLNQAQATQMANVRMAEYRSATSTNEAAFAAMGRDIGSDTSVRAFLEKQRDIVGGDIGRAQSQTEIESMQSRSRAGAEISAGRDAYRSSLLQATATLGSAGYKYSQAR